MEIFRVQFVVIALVWPLALLVPFIGAKSPAPVPAPAPTSDGVAVDQGVAYVLMLLALVLTYIIH